MLLWCWVLDNDIKLEMKNSSESGLVSRDLLIKKQLFFPVPMNSNEYIIWTWYQQVDRQDDTRKVLSPFRYYKHVALQLDIALDGEWILKCHKKA